MKQAILRIYYPEPQPQGGITHDQSQAMTKIQDIAKEQCEHAEDLEVLGEYVWLLKLETHLPILGRLVAIAEFYGISYKVAYLDDELRWDSFNPKSSVFNN